MKKLNSLKDLEFLKNSENENSKESVEIRAIQRTLFINNYFSEVTIEDIDSGFKSVFTDEQVINLIYKISNRNLRKLVWEFERVRFTESDRFLPLKFILHTICLKLLKKFGAKMLSFIIDLKIYARPNEILNVHSNIYNLNLDKEEIEIETIEVKNGYRKKFIGFEVSEYNNKPYMLICNSKGGLEGRINELGYIEDDFINRIRFNIFEFMDGAEFNFLGAVLNAYCSNPHCGKELTVPESIFYGMGPICRGDYYR